MRLRTEPASAALLQRMFTSLVGTCDAATLLDGARAMRALPGVVQAVESAMLTCNGAKAAASGLAS